MVGGAESGAGSGLARWLIERFGRFTGARKREPRLAVLERIALGPRQWLSLIEADRQRVLVATSAEGAPAFYRLEKQIEEQREVPVDEHAGEAFQRQLAKLDDPRLAERGRMAAARQLRATRVS
jgi:flagellar biogenesis protein FliO